MKLVRLAWFVVALASAPAVALADQQPPAEVTPSEAHAWVSLFEKVVDTVVANKDRCSSMARDLNAVVDANQNTIRIARDAKAKGKQLPADARQRMIDGTRRMIAALDKCGRDDQVSAAFMRIDLGRAK
jgi:hypothetical protein